MVIQDIVFPEQGICDVNEMYYRGDAVFIDNALFLSAGKKVSLGTYYNAFSIGKWRKYTRLTSLTIRLFFEKDSDISIKCVHSTARITDPVALTPRTQDQIDPNVKANYEEWPIEVKKDTIDEKEEYSVHFSKLPEDGILFIEIEATTDVVLLGGQYETDCNEINPARIAIGICTFKREEAVKANVHKIINEVLRNPDCELKDDLEVFISDNGQTLKQDEFDCEKVHLFYNRNTGGSGGFTRTIMEAMHKYKGSPFDRMILMDDDITFSTEVLKRTYRLIKLLKHEYINAIIGGAMLLEEKRYIQNESGAKVTDVFRLTPIKYSWDMRNVDLLAANELPEGETYNGWWYCCYSRESILNNNLPNPVFLHFDDVEYCHRLNKYGYILLNGINVWHPSFRGKAKNRTHYYDYRNCLIMNVGSTPPMAKVQLAGAIVYKGMRWLMRYQYDEIKLCNRAIEDFMSGPSCLTEYDQIKVVKDLGPIEENEPIELSSVGVNENEIYREHKKNKFVQYLIQLVELILPPKGRMLVVDCDSIWYPGRHKDVLCYDFEKKHGMVLSRDNAVGLKDFISLLGNTFTLCRNYKFMLKRWNEEKSQYTSFDFWNDFLKQ